MAFTEVIHRTLTTTTATTFDNIDLNNQTGGLTLGSLSGNNITINSLLLLSKGTLTLTSTNFITMASSYIFTNGNPTGTNYYGTIKGQGGDLALGINGGTITCQGKTDFMGTLHLNNVILNNTIATGNPGFGANFYSPTSKVFVNGILQLNGGGFVDIYPPYYAKGSTLAYNTGGEYDCRVEWNSASGAGYPYNVHVISTQLNVAFQSNTITKQCAGSMTIESGGSVHMDWGGAMSKPLNILGSLIINGAMVLSTTVGGDLFIDSTFTNNGTFTHNSKLVGFTGTHQQTINGTVKTTEFAYIKIDNTAGVKLADNIRVIDTLNLKNGILTTTNSDTVIFISNPAGSKRTNGYVYGNIKKQFITSAGAQSFRYMVGTPNGYSPARVSFSSVTAGGNLNATAINAKEPNVPDTAYALNRYWTITPSNALKFSNYNASFNYLSSDFKRTFVEATYEPIMSWGKYNSGAGWTYPTKTIYASANSVLISSVPSFSDFTGFACAVITNNPQSVTLCSGNPASFSVTGSETALSYAWQVNNSSGWSLCTSTVYSNVNQSTLNISNIAGLNGYQYRCLVTGVCGSSVTSSAATLTVNNGPTAPVAGSNSPVCTGNSLNLTSSTISGATYSWSGPNNFGSASQNPIINNAQTNATGIYSVTATLNGCSSTPGTTAVTVNPLPLSPVASNGGAVCNGSTLNLYASIVTGASYIWSGPNNFSSTSQNPTLNNAQTAATGIYSVSATANGCTSSAGTTAVTVYAIPSAPTVGSNSPVCTGSTLNLTASSVSGATYTWSGPNGFTSALQNPTPFTVTTTADAGIYTVSVTQNGCTSSAGTTSVSVSPASVAGTVAPNSSSLCPGVGIPLNLSGNTGSIQWQSSTDDITFTNMPGQTGTSVSTGNLSSTTYFRAVVTSGLCSSAISNVATVIITPSPNIVSQSRDTSVCTGKKSYFIY